MEAKIIQGDCLTKLAELPAESVHCCVTSPPYWNLRDYGHSDQIGTEETPEGFAGKLVQVFREVRRVLRSDATLWLNLGDSFASAWPAPRTRRNLIGQPMSGGKRSVDRPNMLSGFLKEKDLVGIPWRVAFALQADGWYLRADIPWVKRAAMPDSAQDRPGRALEYVFLLSKSKKYYFNMEAVRRQPSGITCGACFGGPLKDEKEQQKIGSSLRTHHRAATKEDRERYAEQGRQMRNCDLWFQSVESPHGLTMVDDQMVGLDVNPRGYKGAHFATFPPDLILPCILAGCPEGGTVLDPFMGSGTTLEVANKNGCHGIGIELNPDYIALARKRLEQPTLFGETA